MRQLLLLLSLVIPTLSQALELSESEFNCLVHNVYLEGRSLSDTEWVKIGAVALNRSHNWDNYHYGAASKNLCDIVSSREYSSRKLLHKPIKEKAIFAKITLRLMQATCLSEFSNFSTIFYFSSLPRRGTHFRESF